MVGGSESNCDDRGRDKEGCVTMERDVGVIWHYESSNMAALGSWTGRKPDSPPEHPGVALQTSFKPMKTISRFFSPEL